MSFQFGAWDIALLIAVSLQATAMAYLSEPRWKAIVYSIPFPFTFAALAVGEPINATNVAGVVLLMLYTQAVRVLHVRWHWPIAIAIAAGVGVYCALATPLAAVLPHSSLAFWLMAGGVLVLGAALLHVLPPRDEPSHRTPLPIYLKLPIIIAVVTVLLLFKRQLGGFVTMFPMVGVVGAYEARHSLWTLGRQVPILMLALPPMMVTCFLAQGVLGLPLALVCAWPIFFVALYCATTYFKSKPSLPLATE